MTSPTNSSHKPQFRYEDWYADYDYEESDTKDSKECDEKESAPEIEDFAHPSNRHTLSHSPTFLSLSPNIYSLALPPFWPRPARPSTATTTTTTTTATTATLLTTPSIVPLFSPTFAPLDSSSSSSSELSSTASHPRPFYADSLKFVSDKVIEEVETALENLKFDKQGLIGKVYDLFLALERLTNMEIRGRRAKFSDYYVPDDPSHLYSCFPSHRCPAHTALVPIDPAHPQGPLLHANAIPLEKSSWKFFAMHAPFPFSWESPGRPDLPKFWGALYHQAPCFIIDLAGRRDVDSIQSLCYYPTSSQDSLSYETIEVLASCDPQDLESTFSMIRQHYQLIPKSGNLSPKTVTRIHTPTWTDGLAIQVDDLRAIVNFLKKEIPRDQPIFVHCYAGLNRTGTLIVAMFLDEGIEQGTITEENYLEFLCFLVIHFRLCRSGEALAHEQQFDLLCEFAKDLISNSKDTL